MVAKLRELIILCKIRVVALAGVLLLHPLDLL